MKKSMFLVGTLILLLLAASALADTTTYNGTVDPIVVNQPGEHTIILDGVTISAEDGSAIRLEEPATKLTIILKDNTKSSLSGSGTSALLLVTSADLTIRCEHASATHVCDDNCGQLNLSQSGTGAAIGSNNRSRMSGSITISGGNLTFGGDADGAFIGSGSRGEMSGTIAISGGNLAFECHSDGANIGSGANADLSGTIAISGGNLTFTNCQGKGPNLGAGANGDLSGSVTVTNSSLVFVFSNLNEHWIGEIGVTKQGNMIGTMKFSDSNILFHNVDLQGRLRIDPFTASNSTIHWYFEGGNCIMGFGKNDTACGQFEMTSYYTTIANESGSAIGFEDDAYIYLDRVDSEYWIKVAEGTGEEDAVPLAGSPYHSYTNLRPLLSGTSYVEFRPADPPATTPTPAPTATPVAPAITPVPTVPQTGDGMNLSLAALAAVISMVGAVMLRRQRKA